MSVVVGARSFALTRIYVVMVANRGNEDQFWAMMIDG